MTDKTPEYSYMEGITQNFKLGVGAAVGMSAGTMLGMKSKLNSFNSKDFKLDPIDTPTAVLCIAGSPIKGTLLIAASYLINLFSEEIPAVLKGISITIGAILGALSGAILETIIKTALTETPENIQNKEIGTETEIFSPVEVIGNTAKSSEVDPVL